MFEKELQPLCVKNGVGVMNFYALAAGFLTGKYRTAEDVNKSARGPKTISLYLNPRGLKILAALDSAATRLNAKQSEIAIAWLLTRPSIAAPIASASNLDQLKSLIRACELTLDPQTLDQLNTASAE